MPKLAVSLDLSELTSPRIHRLHGYWQHQRDRRGGQLPRRGDIAPDQIRDLLPNIMIVDVERDPMRFRYRLVGTRVVEYNITASNSPAAISARSAGQKSRI